MKDPTPLFEWLKFIQTGLVLWPDPWTRTTNPFFYDLVETKVQSFDNNNNQQYYILNGLPDITCESGMMMINKKKQSNILFLSLYFNIYGKDYYYPLLTQGGAGEGDKDTYIAAAYALKSPVYLFHSQMEFVGYCNKKFNSKAFAQCNPLTLSEEQANKIGVNATCSCDSTLFLHMSYPKFLFGSIDNEIIYRGNHILFYETIKDEKMGFELQFWEFYTQLICRNWQEPNLRVYSSVSKPIDKWLKLQGANLKYMLKYNLNSICQSKLIPHLEFLRKWFMYGNKDVSQFQQNIF